MPVGQIIPEITVVLTAVAVLLCASFLGRARQWLCSLLGGGGLALAAAAVLTQLDAPDHITFHGTWAVDGTTTWAKLIIVAASLLTVMLSPEWLREDRRHGEYYAVLCFATLGAMVMAGAADTMQLVLGVLLSSVSGYTLAAYHRDSAVSVEAGLKFFLVGLLTNALLLIGVVWMFALAGSTDYRALADALAGSDASAGWLTAAALVVVGLAFKLGAVPAHTWMPDVAQGAPAPAAAFLAVVPKIGAAIALARLGNLFAAELPGWTPLLATVAAVTMSLGNLAALAQWDLRRLLGWSSVSQSGYALVAVALVGVTAEANAALVYFLAAYASANIAAFAVVTELRGRTSVEDYRGLARSRPFIAAVLAVALLSLVGVPPLAGFVGKTLLMIEAVRAGYVWLAVLLVANTVLSLYYYLRFIGPLYFDMPPRTVPLLGYSARAGMSIAGMLVVALGLGASAMLGHLAGTGLAP